MGKEAPYSTTPWVWIVGLLLLMVPQVGTAYHLSAGATDSALFGVEDALVDSDEGPGNPSVTIDDWRRGIGIGCTEPPEPTGSLDAEDALDEGLQAAQGDHFCDQLDYHDELPDGLPSHFYEDQQLEDRFVDRFEPRTPKDQEPSLDRSFRDPDVGVLYENLKFDARAVSYVGTWGLQTANIFGGNPTTDPQIGGDVYENLAGTPLQPDDEETVCEQEEPAHPQDSCGGTYTGARVAVPNAALFAQAAAEEGPVDVDWEMNGWLVPAYDQSFVAFLTEGAGDEPISDTELEEIVDTMKGESALDPGALPRVCGYVDGIDASRAFPTWDDPCPVPFEYVGHLEGTDGDVEPDRYDDRCEGALYACNTAGSQTTASQTKGPTWFARPVCPATPGERAVFDRTGKRGHSLVMDPEDPERGESGTASSADPPANYLAHDRATWEECHEAFDSTDGYVTWHFVVAPTPSQCGGDQLPGFRTSHSGLQRFLAYDQDVFTPTGSAAGVGGGVEEWTGAVADNAGRTADETAGTQVRKHARVEPNYDASSSPDLGLEDTSQTIEVQREVPLCNILDDEEERVADPWVNVVDATVRPRNLQLSDRSIYPFCCGFMFAENVQEEALALTYDAGAYGTSAQHQDRSNRAGPGHMAITGQVSMAYDHDEDGVFKPQKVHPEDRTSGTPLHEAGAWPMQWEHGDLPPGYGETTGLVQALYLSEPTELVPAREPPSVIGNPGTMPLVFPEGNNVYVFFSDGARELYEDEDSTFVNELVDRITAPFVDEDGFGATLVDDLPERWNELYNREGNNIISNMVGPTGSDFVGDAAWTAGAPDQVFENQWSFTHNCRGQDCSGDTLVTAYFYEVTSSDGSLGDKSGSDAVMSAFRPGLADAANYDAQTTYDFCQDRVAPCEPTLNPTQNVWFDVDPLDNDPDRNREESSSPLLRPPSFE